MTPIEAYDEFKEFCVERLRAGSLQESALAHLDALQKAADQYRATLPPRLLDFTTRVTPRSQPGKVHRFLAERLERFVQDVETNKSPRLLITLPPRHGKSTICSEHFPAYLFGVHPEWPVIHTSYSSDFSNKWSRKVRRLLRTAEYQRIFPGILPSRESGAVDYWEIEDHPGYMVSAGIGGQLTGQGARLVVIDDPQKNSEDAASPLLQARNREWYSETLLTRLEEQGGILCLMTRWNTDDIGGYFLTGAGTDDGPREDWEEVRLPAIAEGDDPLGRRPGDALWPEKYGIADLLKIQAAIPPKSWFALYQQSPIQPEGNMLKVDRIGACSIFTDSADFGLLRVYQAWDLAISAAETAAFTVCATLGVDTDQNLYLLDIRRERLTFNETMRAMEEQARIWKPERIAIETVAYQSAAFQEASRRFMLPFVEVRPRPREDKVMRAQLLADRIEMEKVFANKGAAWWPDFKAEAQAFPNSANKDQCFVAGTMVATPQGDRPIETIRAGDRVLTPFGSRKVLAAGCTGERFVVHQAGLTGTPDHPVFTKENGFIPLDALTRILSLDILSMGGLLQWGYRKLLLSMESSTTSPGRGSITSASHLKIREDHLRRDFTSRFTSFIAAKQFRKAMTFTTRTTILTITTSVTWSAYRVRTMLRRRTGLTSIPSDAFNTWNGFGLSRPDGISPKRGESGTRSKGRSFGRIINRLLESVRHAAARFSLKPRRHAIALSAASPVAPGLRSPSMTFTASSAATDFNGRNGSHPYRPPKRADESAGAFWSRDGDSGKKKVYNLTVDEDHVFYANGVLVSNCDAVAWALSLIPQNQDKTSEELRPHPMSHDGARLQRNRLTARRRRSRL